MLSVMASELIQALKDVKSVVDKKGVLPILHRVNFTATPTRLILTATNLTAGVQCAVLALGEANQPVALDYDSVSATLSKMNPDERVDIMFNDETFVTTFTQGKRSFTSKGMDGNEFPLPPDVETATPIASVESLPLKKHVNFVTRATTTADSRPILSGVNFDFQSEKVTLAGADGYMLHVSSMDSITTCPTTITIPAKALKDMLKMFNPEKRRLFIYGTVVSKEVVVILQQDGYTGWIHCLPGRFPTYQNIIPTTPPVVDILSLSELKDAISFVKETSDDNAYTVTCNFEETQITLSAKSPEKGEVSYVLKDSRTTNIKVSIAMSYALLLESVMGLSDWGTEVEMKFHKVTDPILLTCPTIDNVQAVVMPMSTGRN